MKKPTNIYAVPDRKGGQVTIVNLKDEPSSILSYITADRVASILRAAEGGNMADMWTLYRDLVSSHSHLLTEVGKRILAVVGQRRVITPADPKSPPDQAASDFVRDALDACPGITKSLAHLLSSFVYPVSVAEKVYRPGDGRRYHLAGLVPVPHRLLDYRDGRLRILDTDPSTGKTLSTAHDPDPARYLIHRGSLLDLPDTFGGPFRSILWWCMLSLLDRTWWARFLERYGAPFLLGRYNADDDQSRTVLESAFSFATRIGGLVVTKDTEVEIKEASASSSGEAYEKFLSICNREVSKLILGQTLSSEAQTTGLGSGTATIQEQVRQDIRDYDASTLGETLRDQLFTQLCAINGLRGSPPAISWGGMTVAETKAQADLLTSLATAGLELADDGISELSGAANLKLQRKAAPPTFGLNALSAAPFDPLSTQQAAADQIARSGAAALLQAFRGRHADIPRIIALSTSSADCQARIAAHLADRPPAEVADVLERALVAHAANAFAHKSR
jgi:phage gp29-like protein